MIPAVVLSALLAASTPPSAAPSFNTMEVTLPESQTAPAPNVHLAHFEFSIPGSPRDNAVDYAAMLRLELRLKAIAAATLAHSKSSFGIRASFALMADQAAQFRMQVTAAPPGDAPLLREFYKRAAALKDFHSKAGTVYILFDYRIAPAAQGRRAKQG